jgi:hypothetical protein
MVKTGIQNYTNTIIFCITLKMIAIIILGAILLGYVSDKYTYFLITVEVGIVIIVISALVAIAAYEKKMRAETSNLLASKMTIMSCPDYHTQTDQNMCMSNYETPDGKYTYTFVGGSNVSLSKYINAPIGDACDQFSKDASFVDPSKGMVYMYPWTDMESQCDVL